MNEWIAKGSKLERVGVDTSEDEDEEEDEGEIWEDILQSEGVIGQTKTWRCEYP